MKKEEEYNEFLKWAVKGGRRLLALSFGLGKTRIQIEVCRLILKIEGGKALIVCPLGVRQEFTQKDGPAIGVNIKYCRNMDEVAKAGTDFIITNYERVRDGHIQPAEFTVITLDEGSVLRSYGTQTTQNFMDLCRDVIRMRTLNLKQAQNVREKHVCPLQLDIVERLIEKYTNPGDLIYDPFGGIMTVPYCAVKLGRSGLGCELNEGYWRDGITYLREAEWNRDIPTLFDVVEFEEVTV